MSDMVPVDLLGLVLSDRYRVEGRLGVGGMGSVWRVRHVESLERFALKTLHPRVASDATAVHRFLREARASTALHSKHVVKIVDAQMSHLHPATNVPMPYLVMELLEGSNLEDLVAARGRLPRAEVVWIVRQVARALDLAHAKGIVHRDLKPANLFIALDEDGEPVTKLCDFGIAKLVHDEAGTTAGGTHETGETALLGTPMYMAPEQVRNAASVDARADQWALGLIVFRALTGRDYFGRTKGAAGLLLEIVHDPMPKPSSLEPVLDASFDAWFSRSCARAPEGRFSSVGEQSKALAEALAITEATPPRPVVQRAEVQAASTIDHDTSVDPTKGSDPRATTGAPAASTHGSSAQPTRPRPNRRIGIAAIAIASVATLGIAASRWPRGRSNGETHAAAKASSTSSALAPNASTSTPSETVEVPAPPIVPSIVPSIASSPKPLHPAAIAAKAPIPSAVASVTSSAIASASAPVKRPKGATCARSIECASGFCVAEVCR